MQDLLQRFHLFEPRGFFCRNIVAISGPVRLGDSGLGRNNTYSRAPCDTLGAKIRGNRSFVIGLGHRGTLCMNER